MFLSSHKIECVHINVSLVNRRELSCPYQVLDSLLLLSNIIFTSILRKA